MDAVARNADTNGSRAGRPARRRGFPLWLMLGCGLLTGCAAYRPLDGVPVDEVYGAVCAPQRSEQQMIDLSLLRQPPPPEYRVDAGDVLGVYIDGVLGNPQLAVPVYQPPNPDLPPSTGYPIQVRADGTISLPLLDPLNVRGLTIPQVDQRIRQAYANVENGAGVFPPGKNGILVSLQKPRLYRVLVIRQEISNNQANFNQLSQIGRSQNTKFGAGQVVSLPAYRNDVLNALAETGGLPGLDAENVIYVIRGGQTVSGPFPVAPPPAPAGEPLGLRSPTERATVRAQNADDFLSYSSWRGGHAPSSPPDDRLAAAMAQAEAQMTAGRPAPEWDVDRPSDSRMAAALAQVEAEMQRYRPALEPQPPYRGNDRMSAPPARAEAEPIRQRPAWTAPPPIPQVTPARPAPVAPPSLPLVPLMPQPTTTMPWSPGPVLTDGMLYGPQVIRIPLRVSPEECPLIRPEDVILHDGDIVFIESRQTEFFFTGGLLGGGQFALPRDYDLDVVQAIAIAESQGTNPFRPTKAIGGVSALNQDVTVGASEVIVFRKLPGGGELPIEIDLYRAMRHPEERIVIQPGDRIVLQYSCLESIGAFFERHVMEATIIGVASGLRFGN